MADKELKAVDEMGKDECLAELETLSQEVDFEDAKWNKRTKVDTLRALVAEGREALGDDSEDDEEEEEEDVDADDTDEEEEDDESDEDDDVELDEDAAPKGAGVHIYDAGGNYVRTYTKKAHGKNYKELAKRFLEKSGRENFSSTESK